MILGTSKIWSKSGPADLLTITKMAQNIQEKLWNHPGQILFMSIWDSQNSENFSILDPPNTYFFWKFFAPNPPPKKIGISERFQRFFRWWNLGILGQSFFWKYQNISKSYWIKNIFQMVTYHLSKNLSPRTFLVFMENHPFENFSPHTFLVFMENHGFELYGFPLNSRK